MTEEQLKACEASAPYMVEQYRKLKKAHSELMMKSYEQLNQEMLDENEGLQLEIQRKDMFITQLKTLVSRLMWPIYTGHQLSGQVIDDATKLGWGATDWKR